MQHKYPSLPCPTAQTQTPVNNCERPHLAVIICFVRPYLEGGLRLPHLMACHHSGKGVCHWIVLQLPLPGWGYRTRLSKQGELLEAISLMPMPQLETMWVSIPGRRGNVSNSLTLMDDVVSYDQLDPFWGLANNEMECSVKLWYIPNIYRN